jgi:hypothetical protein
VRHQTLFSSVGSFSQLPYSSLLDKLELIFLFFLAGLVGVTQAQIPFSVSIHFKVPFLSIGMNVTIECHHEQGNNNKANLQSVGVFILLPLIGR